MGFRSKQGRRGLLVEQRSEGGEYWFLVADGIVLHAVQRTEDGPLGHGVKRFRPGHLASASKAARAFAGPDICEVGLMIEDRRKTANNRNHAVWIAQLAPILNDYQSPVWGEWTDAVRDLIDLHLGVAEPHAGAFDLSRWQPRFRVVRRKLAQVRSDLAYPRPQFGNSSNPDEQP